MPATLALPATSDDAAEDDRDATLRLGAARLRPLKRCARVAWLSSVTLIGFGALSLLMALAGADASGALVGGVVLGVGAAEAVFRGQLERGDARAPGRLALNQVVLILAASAYCLVRLTASPEQMGSLVFSPETSAALADAEGSLATMGHDLETMAAGLVRLVYGAMLAAVVVGQGSLALYYASKRRAVTAYVDEVPAWAREVLEAL